MNISEVKRISYQNFKQKFYFVNITEIPENIHTLF